jgi:PAS domain S-box-containing protein
MKSFLIWLFGSNGFMSHGHCYLWNPALVSLHVISDLAIGVAYAAISLTLVYLVRRARNEIPFHWIFLAFGGFIIACGLTHFMEVWTIWKPVYWLSGIVKAITAIASVTTAIVLPRLVPETLDMIRDARLADQHRLELEQANVAIRRLNEDLEAHVQARTAELEQANEQLAEKAAIVNHSNDAIFSKTLNRIITSWNPSAEHIYGYSAAEIIGQDVAILVPEEKKPELQRAMEQLARGEVVESFETVRVRKDGTPIDVYVSLSPVCDTSGRVRGASVIARDITDRKRAERQLRETQKLESLGLIAGGIAHDFNNLLVGILGNSSLVLDSLDPADPNRGFLENVVAASEKAAHLTRQMLAYAGKGRFLAEPVDLAVQVREIGNLLRTSIPKSVELQLNLEDRLPAIVGDHSQFQQLIMNLTINGAEAIGENRNGKVTLAAYSQFIGESIDEGFVQGDNQTPPGLYVVLEVTDTGCGMDEETKSKIFDPFFTTKFTGRGLGLAAALGIVRGHSGTIRVRSDLGKGTTFTVMLPATAQAAPPAPVDPGHSDLKGSGTVLVVDDEELVRAMSTATLKRFGYTVLTAANGQEAVDIFRLHADEITAVLLDLTMPIMSGEDAFLQIRQIRPQVPVIVSSGYNQVEAVRRFTSESFAAFIQKPYTAIQLARTLKRVLGKAND